jgi:hypothetical protein
MFRVQMVKLAVCLGVAPAASAQAPDDAPVLERLSQFEQVFEQCSAELLDEITSDDWAGFGVRGQLSADKAGTTNQFRSFCESGTTFDFDVRINRQWARHQVHTIAAVFRGVMISTDGRRTPNDLRVSLIIAPDDSGTMLIQHSHLSVFR